MAATERRVRALEQALKFYVENVANVYMLDNGRRGREALAVDPWDSGPAGHATEY